MSKDEYWSEAEALSDNMESYTEMTFPYDRDLYFIELWMKDL